MQMETLHGIQVKLNMLFEPYDNGTLFEATQETVLYIDCWKKYIEFLAKNRYNYLSLWSENPFFMILYLDKYPNICHYDDVALEKHKNIFNSSLNMQKILACNCIAIMKNKYIR